MVEHEGLPERNHQHTSCVEKIVPAGLLSALGLDLYTKGRAVDGITVCADSHRWSVLTYVQVASSNAGKRANPFDLGFIRNCSDFWTRGRTLGVDYTSVSLLSLRQTLLSFCSCIQYQMKDLCKLERSGGEMRSGQVRSGMRC